MFALLGLLAPAPFPVGLVQALLEISEQAVRQALGSLINFSVLRRPGQNYEVSHPLIHTFAKERLSSQADRRSSDVIERLLATLLTHFERSNRYDQMTLSLWSPHVVPLLSATDLTTSQRLSAAHLFSEVGSAALTQGKYAEAEPLLRRALSIYEQELGPQHPDTASSLNNLALLYKLRGKYGQAESLYERALAICEQQLGAQHPSTAISLNNLAELYKSQGKYEQAEPLLRWALAICEQQLGAQHPSTAQVLNNLAELYKSQDKDAEAEPLYERALAIRAQELGPQHPDTANSLNNLAVLYCHQGKYEQAEPLLQRALAICEQQLRVSHSTTQIVRNNYTSLLIWMERESTQQD